MFERNRKTPSSIKIIDFGAAVPQNDQSILEDLHGTPFYVAPEVLSNYYGPKCDIWSVGVITYVALSGKPPFNGSTDDEIIH